VHAVRTVDVHEQRAGTDLASAEGVELRMGLRQEGRVVTGRGFGVRPRSRRALVLAGACLWSWVSAATTSTPYLQRHDVVADGHAAGGNADLAGRPPRGLHQLVGPQAHADPLSRQGLRLTVLQAQDAQSLGQGNDGGFGLDGKGRHELNNAPNMAHYPVGGATNAAKAPRPILKKISQTARK